MELETKPLRLWRPARSGIGATESVIIALPLFPLLFNTTLLTPVQIFLMMRLDLAIVSCGADGGANETLVFQLFRIQSGSQFPFVYWVHIG